MTNSKLKYLIAGTGGVGGSIAAFLALAGKNVTCIARGEHLAAIHEHGLRLHSDLKGEHTLKIPAYTAEEYTALASSSAHFKADVIFVCVKGLQNGLERVTKVMMIALLVIMVVLAVNSLFMPGAKEGLSFFLVPDFARMQEVGVVNTLVSAMNQAFFTLSLGIGAMSIFGSYIGKEHSLLGESARIVVLDTFVAITAGLIIFPACFTYGVDQTSGPSLIFITLPNIFANMSMGRLWGSLFFLFMAFAAMSTVLAVFENIICCGMELTGCSRKKSSLVNLVLIILLSMPCVLGYNLWAWDGFAVFGGAVLDVEDFLVSNLFLPLGSLVYLLFCVTRYGWGWQNYKKEVNTGKGLKVQDWMRGYLTYVLPLIVVFIFAFGLYDKFLA